MSPGAGLHVTASPGDSRFFVGGVTAFRRRSSAARAKLGFPRRAYCCTTRGVGSRRMIVDCSSTEPSLSSQSMGSTETLT